MAEKKRLQEKFEKEKATKESWIRKHDDAETAARLEKAQRQDEVRLLKEKVAQLERSAKRTQDSQASLEKRVEDLNRQLGDERTKSRALEDDKIKFASKLRAAESSIR